ncbi:glycoside hydrolase family 27 protein [Leeuwenhoekiella parthenopeia]|uniref:Alpha-galactosidase n=1 Tax=Leeuwenhoekiella parthenopeia TaxID=2890320 RepID=A0ABS8GNJ6_9FLAO|nr:glycoside hydrolase family 27 protein [Leeuwenhoekiella parthenopeia]MCC4211255.1 glycoside hydrolase family 27 protein [Leeuwenhoekiella parthenopeia]
MNKIKFIIILCLGVLTSCVDSEISSQTANTSKSVEKNISVDTEFELAATPPMGWNSFDAYDCRINEEEFKATVDYMAENLKEYGWEYAVIDYIWWHPNPGNWDTPRRKGHPNIRYNDDGSPLYPEYTNMDEFGRLIPAVERFPSAAGGKGFKPIADYVHNKGLKFGIHIMRGIHRVAAFQATPIMGTNMTAKDIAEPFDTCNWCNHMYGVDGSKEGAQEYYDSLFKLYAEWGVDFIKADDTMFPPYHDEEIEMIHKAIEKSGRPMILSLSCGEAPVSRAPHLIENANMWRISADFWDNWESLEHNFDLLNAWSPFIGPGHWPDGDMLPIGKLSLNDRPHGKERMSNFTEPEHYTLMTLWSIAKSPLMMGGDLLSTPESTMKFLKNRDVIYVNQHSVDNRQVIKHNNEAIWIATDPANGDRFIALFNLADQPETISFNLEDESLRGTFKVKDLWEGKYLENVNQVLSAKIAPHGGKIFRLTKL